MTEDVHAQKVNVRQSRAQGVFGDSPLAAAISKCNMGWYVPENVLFVSHVLFQYPSPYWRYLLLEGHRNKQVRIGHTYFAYASHRSFVMESR